MRVKWWELIRLVITIGKLSKIIGLNRFFFTCHYPVDLLFRMRRIFIYQQIPMHSTHFSFLHHSSSFCSEFVFSKCILSGIVHIAHRNEYKNRLVAFFLIFTWEFNMKNKHYVEHWTHRRVFTYRLFRWQTHS